MQLNNDQRMRLKGLCQEISRSMETISSEREMQSDALKLAAAELEIPAKALKAAAKMYHDASLVAKTEEFDLVTELVEQAIR